MIFALIIILFLVIPFALGLVFFLRFLIFKKSKSCGCVFLAAIISVVCFLGYFIYSLEHISDSGMSNLFESRTALSFPPSGKIIEKDYNVNIAAGDEYHFAIIEMDTLDYIKILHEIQTGNNFLSKGEGEPNGEYVYRYNVGKVSLDFHKNKQIIRYTMTDF